MFENRDLTIETQDDARKRKIDKDAAWNILKNYQSIIIGKGKKMITYKPDDASKDEILKAALGRSGNLRAPTIEIEGKLVIGYNEEMYAGLIL